MRRILKKVLLAGSGVVVGILLTAGFVLAGNLMAGGAPTDASTQMFTLQQVYDRLVSGDASDRAATFTEPSSTPGTGTMATLDEIMAVAPAVDNGAGAAPAEVLAGKRYWGLRDDRAQMWGIQSGAMPDRGVGPTIVPTTTDVIAAEGFWSSAITVTGDSDLTMANIRQGVTLYGVTGTAAVDPTSGTATAADLLDGKVAWVNGTQITGTLPDLGVGATIMPTVTDQIVAQGYWSTPITVMGDANLTPATIRGGVTLFGVAGDQNVVDTSSGNASAAEMLQGVVGWVDGAAITGTVVARGIGPTLVPTTATQTLDAGFYTSPITVTGDSDLAANNIRGGVTLFEVAGDVSVVDTSSGDAMVTDLLEGVVAWVDGAAITGTIPNRGAGPIIVPATTEQIVSEGFYSTPITVTGDSNLVAGNVLNGVTLFGVTGDESVVDTSSGDAAASDLISGMVAWADGVALTGTIPARGIGPTIMPTTTNHIVDAGFWSTPITVTGDSDLLASNIRQGVTLFGVTGNKPLGSTSSANPPTADLIREGKVAWANGEALTGTMKIWGNGGTLVPTTTQQIVQQGYYSSAITVQGDTDLAAANIRIGVNLFGITGTVAATDIYTGALVATGQTVCYDAAGAITACTSSLYPNQDGQLKRGIPLTHTWNINPRFVQLLSMEPADGSSTPVRNGAVLDRVTGLVWLRWPACYHTLNGITPFLPTQAEIDSYAGNPPKSYSLLGLTFSDTLTWVRGLAGGSYAAGGTACELLDGSQPGDWRIPNINELMSLIDFRHFQPPLGNGTQKCTSSTCAFRVGQTRSSYVLQNSLTSPYDVLNTPPQKYWSNTTAYNGVQNSNLAWCVDFDRGAMYKCDKRKGSFAWPVRDGRPEEINCQLTSYQYGGMPGCFIDIAGRPPSPW